MAPYNKKLYLLFCDDILGFTVYLYGRHLQWNQTIANSAKDVHI
jgi:hypothetical protein